VIGQRSCATASRASPGHSDDQAYPHRGKHALHPWADMLGGDHIHTVVEQEPGDPRVVRSLGTLIVLDVPGDGRLAPTIDHTVHDFRDGDAVRPTPSRINVPGRRERNAHCVHL